MNQISTSRSAALWLILMLCGFTFAQAQNLSNAKASETGDNDAAKTNLIELADLRTAKEMPRSDKTDFSGTVRASLKKSERKSAYQTDENIKMKEWGFYGGSFTFHKDLKGESQKAPVVLFGIRHAWSIKNNSSRRFRYYMDLNPLIIVNYRQRRLVQTSPTTTATVGERKTVFGVGFVPLGLQYNWRNSKKYQPFIAGGMGFALFNKKFPDNRSALEPDEIGNRFQIMPEFGAGVEIRQTESKSYFIGYKYHHMSNGYTAPLNVGYNTNMLYFGVYKRREK